MIPIAVKGELNNPLILIQQHALLMMTGAMTNLFPWHSDKKEGWVDVTAQPGQCSAALLINRECIWGQHQ